MTIVCQSCGGEMECVEYCMACNPDGLDITEETALKEKVVEAAVAWANHSGGSGDWGVAVYHALLDAVSALQAHREAP